MKLKSIWVALCIYGFSLSLTLLFYSGLLTWIAHVLFAEASRGSLIEKNTQSVPLGSRLIFQSFEDPKYFHGRLQKASVEDIVFSGAFHQSVLNSSFLKRTQDRLANLSLKNPGIGMERWSTSAVFASGSGLDPHITYDFAKLQIPRIARARGIAERDIEVIIEKTSCERGFLSQERILNVLLLNLNLDKAL